MDSNGDGVGDFEGLMRRLDYLQGLGITAIWLMPFQASPGRDDGYECPTITGSSALRHAGRLRRIHARPKQRGIRVLIDLVVNHTSDQHPWFKEARRDPNRSIATGTSGRRKSRRAPNKGMVFPGVQKSTWTYDPEAKAWYFHRFYDFQPDLNTSNPRGAGRDLEDHGVLDSARRFGLPDGRSPLRHRDQGRERAQACGTV